MLRLTLERVGPDGTGTAIGHAVVGRWSGGHVAAVTDDRHGTCGWCRHAIDRHSWEHPRDELLLDDGKHVCRRCDHCYPDGAPATDPHVLQRQARAAAEQMGGAGPVHIAAVTDDRHGTHVGRVVGHDADDGPWALIAAAVAAWLDGDADLTKQQRAVLERALGRAMRGPTTVNELAAELGVLTPDEVELLEGLADDGRGGALDSDSQFELGTLVLKALAEMRNLRREAGAALAWAAEVRRERD